MNGTLRTILLIAHRPEVIGHADRVPVPHRPRQGGNIAIGRDILGENPPRGRLERNLLNGWRRARGAHGSNHRFARFWKRVPTPIFCAR